MKHQFLVNEMFVFPLSLGSSVSGPAFNLGLPPPTCTNTLLLTSEKECQIGTRLLNRTHRDGPVRDFLRSC